MGEFRRISDCDDPMEVLGAPMEIGLITETLKWPIEWDSSHGGSLTSAEGVEIVVNLAPEEFEGLSKEQCDELMIKFAGLLGRHVHQLPDEQPVPGLNLVYSILERSGVGKQPADLEEIIRTRLSNKLSCQLKVSVNIIDYGDDVCREIEIGDVINLSIKANNNKKISKKYTKLLGSRVIQIDPRLFFLRSILSSKAIGARPCVLAFEIQNRLSDALGKSFRVSVNRLSDLSSFENQESNLTRVRDEFFNRYYAALKLLTAEIGATDHVIPDNLETKLEGSARERQLAYRAVRGSFPGAEPATAMLAFENDMMSKMERSSEARSKFTHLACALSVGYRPPESPETLVKEGSSSIPQPFATAGYTAICSPKWTTDEVRDGWRKDIRGQEDRDARSEGDAISKRFAKRSKYAWPKLLFHSLTSDIHRELEISKHARSRSLVPPRRVFLEFAALSYREFNRAYDQAVIFDHVKIRHGSGGQWMMVD